jgi:predicted PhzF superfamily epimerase YddE/YHI9
MALEQDRFAIYDSEDQIRELAPDFLKMKSVGLSGVGVSAPGKTKDFVSRFFAPKLGVNEDAVTGSPIANSLLIGPNALVGQY